MTISPKAALALAVAGLTEDQAKHVYNALAQWADNTRNGLDDTYDDLASEGAQELAQVETVDGLVEAYETELVKLAT